MPRSRRARRIFGTGSLAYSLRGVERIGFRRSFSGLPMAGLVEEELQVFSKQ